MIDGTCLRRAATISRSTCLVIARLFIAGGCHHQPSRCICRAAATTRSATAAKSASV
jgi:hypothetical protein